MISNCPDCAVKPNNFHVVGCDVEICPECGWQLISCDCEDTERVFEDSQDDSFSFRVFDKVVSRKRLKWSG